MNNKEHLEDLQIDAYYQESVQTSKLNEKLKLESFLAEKTTNKLVQLNEKLKILDEEVVDFEIDTMKIIEQGIHIQETKYALKEFVLFLFVASVCLVLTLIIVFQLGITFWMMTQVVMIVIVPWLVIPVLALKRRAGEI